MKKSQHKKTTSASQAQSNTIEGKSHKKHIRVRHFIHFGQGMIFGAILLILLTALTLVVYRRRYENRVYPGVTINAINFSGSTQEEIVNHWMSKNISFKDTSFTFVFENQIATLSGESLEIGFDATLSATQAVSVGRSGQFLTDVYHIILAQREGIDLNPLFTWNEELFDTTLTSLAQAIDIPAENALFEFKDGRVTAFKTSKPGRVLDQAEVKRRFVSELTRMTEGVVRSNYVFDLPVITQEPDIATSEANEFGIHELLGRGESLFRGSIPGRVHNVALAASRVNGVLIPPGETFSFNQTVGDISAATGYKQAYVIKSGRTVLDDGGGVCQVSTTLFRAALNSGLPITERHAHSYRVGYYEQGGWKPGFDATVYAPSYDLKFTNDTPSHILIQANADTKNLSLTFEFYGKKDGRVAQTSQVTLTDPVPAPPDLYQDDPTLPTGQVKQVDWANPGIKASFTYTVTRNGEEIFAKKFNSNFVPWQAVYLRGTGPT